MKSKSLFPTHKPLVMLPLPQGPKHFYKCLTVVVVIGLHVFVVWMLSHLIEPYTLTASPKVNALKVRFVSLSTSENPSPHTTAQIAIAQPQKQQILKKAPPSRAMHERAETIEQKILISQNATNTVQEKKLSKKVYSVASQPIQTVAVQIVENKVVNQQTQTDQQSAAVNQNQHMRKEQTGDNRSAPSGVKTPSAHQELTRAPESQVEPDELIQVSSIDVLSFGKFSYDDRELRQQNRTVELRLRINENGQPIDIQLKQSSGIASLDERVLNAARQSKFKPYKVNSRAVAIVVDFPVQLKLSRSRR